MCPAACGLRVGSAPPSLPRSSANATAAPAQPRCSRPRRRDLHANKKEKGEGLWERRAPCARLGARSCRLRIRGFITRVSLGPQALPTHHHHHTPPSSRHLSEGSEFTSFVWMLSAPPPPTPTFATLTLTPSGAPGGGLALGASVIGARTSGCPGPEASVVRPAPAAGAGYSPVNGEIYRHEVLGKADPRPCDLKTITASRVRLTRAQTGAAEAEREHWAFAGPPFPDSPAASGVGGADRAPCSSPSSGSHEVPGKLYL